MRLALSGKMCAGKTFAATHIAEKYGFTVVSLADAIKTLISDLWGVNANDKEHTRELLVSVGEHLCLIDQHVWVNRLLRNLPAGDVVVDDLRKPQEFMRLRDEGFTTVRISVRPSVQLERTAAKYPTMRNESLTNWTETALDCTEFDYRVNGNTAALLDEMDLLVQRERVLGR